MPLLTEWDLRLDADAVLRGQGADPAIIRTRNMRLVNIAAQALEEGIPMVRPQVLFASYDGADSKVTRVSPFFSIDDIER